MTGIEWNNIKKGDRILCFGEEVEVLFKDDDRITVFYNDGFYESVCKQAAALVCDIPVRKEILEEKEISG